MKIEKTTAGDGTVRYVLASSIKPPGLTRGATLEVEILTSGYVDLDLDGYHMRIAKDDIPLLRQALQLIDGEQQ